MVTTQRPQIGLDVGSSAVRAVELLPGRPRPRLRRFAQVGLPHGAVSEGEVQDVEAVGHALRQLWLAGGFSSTDVVVGVSSQLAIVRQADVSAMSEADFRSALEFEVADLLPIPLDDAAVDFRIIDPSVPTIGDAVPRMRVVLAAAHRRVIDSHLAALSAAGLSAQAVDIGGLALLRSLHPGGATDDGTRVVVSVGAELTEVAVGHGDTPQFLRVLAGGGSAVTKALAAEWNVPELIAERAKRSTAAVDTMPGLGDEVEALVGRIADSLAYVAARSDVSALQAVELTGGGSQLPGLYERLAERLSYPLRRADAFAAVDVDPEAIAPSDRERVASLVQTALGLAAYPRRSTGRQLNLLPIEIVERRRQHRAAVTAAAGVAAVAAALGSAWYLQHREIRSVDQQQAAVVAASAAQQVKIDRLGWVTSSVAAVQARTSIAEQLARQDIDWDAAVRGIAAAMPAGATLSSLSFTSGSSAGTTVATAPAATGTTTPASLAAVSMQVTARGGEDAVAVWLRSMRTVPWLADVWVPSSSISGGTVTFSTSGEVVRGVPLLQRQGVPK